MSKNVSKSERVRLILSAAEALFLEHGYSGTSLHMLTAQAGGSRRTIYAEFGNKEGLFKAVIEQKTNDMASILSEFGDVLDPKNTLVKVCQTFLKKMLQPDMLALFKLMLNTLPFIPDLGDKIYQNAIVKGTKPLAIYLSRLHEAGVININNSLEASQLLLGMVKGPLHLHCLLDASFVPSEQQINGQVEQAVDIFLNGILTNQAKL
ncbi:TetR/AcrR family transcriptional regulator [Paraglaciecola sp. 2405UD69-4]|uniref:TetR/AcrR family transcriptional regulator n=1 Tax=Paraglaciecola sp. 2405UD69-4 TaxID=3391836 RepID=UPI0039C90957